MFLHRQNVDFLTMRLSQYYIMSQVRSLTLKGQSLYLLSFLQFTKNENIIEMHRTNEEMHIKCISQRRLNLQTPGGKDISKAVYKLLHV